MDRAYSFLTLKALDEESRVIEGIASSPAVDRVGDVLDPLGAQFTLPMPLLLHHRKDEPIGEVVAAEPSSASIHFKARIPKITEPGRLKDRIDEAWHSVRHGLIKGISVGFKPLKGEPFPATGGTHYKSWEWLETSCVVIPANVEASISVIKRLDTESMLVPQHEAQLDPQLKAFADRLIKSIEGYFVRNLKAHDVARREKMDALSSRLAQVEVRLGAAYTYLSTRSDAVEAMKTIEDLLARVRKLEEERR